MAANMDPTSSMIHKEARLASFSASSSQAPSKSRSKKSTVSQSPGHDFPLDPNTFPNLTPEALSTAGFFFRPAEDDETDDTCQCFLCGLQLGGWDEGDDPFEEHVKRHNCPWAEFVCLAKLNRRKGIKATYTTPEDLPSSAQSSEWREVTYQKWWPHKQKSAWLPTVKNLAKAGFVFYPSAESPDLVVCPFCDYGVEGWEATDDPWAIHYKKSPMCEFFTAKVGESSEPAAATGKAKTGGKKTKRGTTAAKATSTAPESADPSDEEAENPNEARAALGRSTAGRAPRQAKPRVTSRSRSKTRPVEEPVDEPVASEAEASAVEEVEVDKSTKPRKAGRRGKGRKQAEEVAEVESEAPVGDQDEEVAEAEAKPTKARRSRKKKDTVQSEPTEPVESDTALMDIASDPPAKEKKQRGRKKTTKQSGESQADAQIGRGKPTTSTQRMTRSVSGRSAQSKQSVVEDDSEVSESAQESEADMELPEVVPTEIDEEASEDGPVDAEKTIRAPSPPSKQTSKSAKSGKSTKSAKSAKSQNSQSTSAHTTSEPRSQLDRFAVIPPSSPFPNSQPSRPTTLRPPTQPPIDTTPRPRATMVSSKATKASPHVQLPRETLDKSLVEGAREARRVMDDLVLNSTGEQDLQGLSEEQQGMTLEELVRGEMKKRYESLKIEGEEMIRKWEERGKEARRKIETL